MLWTPFPPMDPEPHARAFADPDFAFQVKWDGVRMVAHTDGRTVRLWNKRLHERTAQYPELVGAVQALVGGRSAILDGEVVAMGPTGPHFPSVLRRDWATAPATIAAGVRRTPVVYMVFDLVYLDGRPLIDRSFAERDARLIDVLGRVSSHPDCAGLIQPVESFAEHGNALFDAAGLQGLEGIVAKRLASPYRLGKTPEWRKIKHFRRVDCLVGGFSPARGGIVSLRVGVPNPAGGLRYAGRVGAGLSARTDAELLPRLRPLCSGRCPFDPPPRIPNGAGTVQWVQPALAITVEFLEWTDELLLRHPKYLGLAPAAGAHHESGGDH